MPPKQQSQRRTTQSQNEQVYNLGVNGRRTGLTLEEKQRDEHGFEAVDNLFSSPEKDVNNGAANRQNGVNGRNHTASDDEQDMEIDDESQMGPATTMKQRQTRPSLPRARSPIKTHLQSPARQNPHLGPTSSPTRGSVVTAREHSPPRTVNRRLNFSQGPQSRTKPSVNGHSKANGVKGRNGKLTNGRTHSSESEEEEVIMRGARKQHRQEEEEEDEEEEEEGEDQAESMQIIDAGFEDDNDVANDRDETPLEPEPQVEEESEEQIQEPESSQQPKKRRGRKPKSPVVEGEEGEASIIEPAPTQAKASSEPSKKKQRGRPARTAQPAEDAEPPKPPKRRRSGRNSGGSASEEQEQEQQQEEENNVAERETKRQRTEKKEAKALSSKPTATKEKGKPGRKRKSSGVGVDEPVVQRGPPLPKGRGLVALRREEDEDIMRTTRSGRASYRPLEFWRGEHVLYDESKREIFEDKNRHFMMPAVKGVVRVAEEYTGPKRRRGRPAKKNSKAGRRSSTLEEEEVERDAWEFESGRIAGECLYWRPDGAQQDDGVLEITEEELAVSEAAIQLKNIKDATFRFAKTLTMPFFGSGIVDMPPGSEKRTKNSSMMQMVFFVHTGSVEVRVARTEFRIGMGGMWFVPRGNLYSITNPSDRPARIFFAQGCEVVAPVEEEAQE